VLYRRLYKLWTDVGGQDMIEYALLAAGFAMASAAFIPNLYPSFSLQFSRVLNALPLQ
jgi:Flp pilus assembly pilin Flp